MGQGRPADTAAPVGPAQGRGGRPGLGRDELPRPDLGLSARHRNHRADLQQGPRPDAPGHLGRGHRAGPQAGGPRQARHPVALHQELLHLAHDGRGRRRDLWPRCARRLRRRPGGCQHRRGAESGPGAGAADQGRPHAQGRELRRDGIGIRPRRGGDDDLRPLGLGQRPQGQDRLRRGGHPGRRAGQAQQELCRRAGLHDLGTQQAQGHRQGVHREPPDAARGAEGAGRRRAHRRAGPQGLLRRAVGQPADQGEHDQCAQW
mmetsp:Transcript_21601/g.51256  ORF Transcript_21601/g.51256 Transcript_21601/m.51256 type:complete len:261 (-) Transcript_21601:570-1352(-)